MKYSNNFNSNFKWYLSVRHKFEFSGADMAVYNNLYSKNGVSGKEAFYIKESTGKLVPTKHINLFKTLCNIKASISLHITSCYAPDRANGCLPLVLAYNEIYLPLNAPEWFIIDVETAKLKFYESEELKYYAEQELVKMKEKGVYNYLRNKFT